ncbi:serine/threonine protein kinase [Marinihelvus fidelis]|uniref:Stress response kinase A n=1 Tax=Marinihelvus fidelis TaxID=2613842 RepID=A0A5N0T9L1_9GAMM|nr:serine/threonine protein kinase [Marinihelvus fidelis]KAA9131418.1 serine/threonine protein kinase [Marinihelvus fidelis]
MDNASDNAPYYELGPDTVIHAVESTGRFSDGRLLALNSYENRVYQVGMEEGPPLVAKFYRPGRWTDAQILEEHAFALELADADIPMVPPMVIDGGTLFRHDGFRFALFERRGGHAPELDDRETRIWLGRFMARIHAVGASKPFAERPALTPARFGRDSLDALMSGQWLPMHLETAFSSLGEDLMTGIEAAWERAGSFRSIRLHGDCHVGNILWRDGPFFVDLDDCQSGPAVQDLWMFLSGERDEMETQLKDLVQGYREFHDFDLRELNLVEALRTLRMLHHAAWLARRWEDPAFPIAFPWFDDPRYWENLVLGLREQLGRLAEPPLEIREW